MTKSMTMIGAVALPLALLLGMAIPANANHDYVEQCDPETGLVCAWASTGWGAPAQCTIQGSTGHCSGNFEWFGGGWGPPGHAGVAEVQPWVSGILGSSNLCVWNPTFGTQSCWTERVPVWVECPYGGISPVQARAQVTTWITGEPDTGWTWRTATRCELPL